MQTLARAALEALALLAARYHASLVEAGLTRAEALSVVTSLQHALVVGLLAQRRPSASGSDAS